jgi:N utilization substance protein B
MCVPETTNAGAAARPSRHKARRLALQAVYQWLLADAEVDELLQQFARLGDLRGADWEFAQALVRGAVANRGELEARMALHLDRPLDQLDPVEHAVLLLGAFELLRRPDVPYRAAINEGVNLAKVFGATDSYKYINGILDRLAREINTPHSGGR